MKNYDLIIFDCDGTLVASEYLNNKVTADVLTKYGLEGYTAESCMQDFAGRDWKTIKSLIDEKHDIDLPRRVIESYIETVQEKMPEYLEPIKGAVDFVAWANDNFKICIGSNGERGNVTKSLSLMGLDKFFPDKKTFTKIQVANAKPAPDLFYYAAQQMGVDPAKALVIEDSVSGLKAGVAAGMDTLGFTGAAHDKKKAETMLKNNGALAIFDEFIHIKKYLSH